MVDCINNRNSFFRIVNLDKNFDEIAILNIIMDKNQKETDKYLKLIYSNDKIIRTNQRVNSWLNLLYLYILSFPGEI